MRYITPCMLIYALVSKYQLNESLTLCPNLTSAALPSNSLRLAIVLYKDKCSYFRHPIYQAFSLFLATKSIPKSQMEAMELPPWKVAMDVEYEALV